MTRSEAWKRLDDICPPPDETEINALMDMVDGIAMPGRDDYDRALAFTTRNVVVPGIAGNQQRAFHGPLGGQDCRKDARRPRGGILPKDDASADSTGKEVLSKEALNMRLMQLAEADPEFARNPSPTAWAKAVGAAKSSVSATPFYKQCKKLHGKLNKPKVESFTEVHADNLGQVDDALFRLEDEEERAKELQRLISQSEREARLEPSPIDDDPPGNVKRPRQYRS